HSVKHIVGPENISGGATNDNPVAHSVVQCPLEIIERQTSHANGNNMTACIRGTNDRVRQTSAIPDHNTWSDAIRNQTSAWRYAANVLRLVVRAFVAKNNAGCAGAVSGISNETRAEDGTKLRVEIVSCVSVVLPEIPAELRQQTPFCRIIRPILDVLRIARI